MELGIFILIVIVVDVVSRPFRKHLSNKRTRTHK